MAEEVQNKETEVLLDSIGKVTKIQGKKITIRPYSWVDTFRMAKPLAIILDTLFSNYAALNNALKTAKTSNVMMQLKLFTDLLGAIDNTEEVMDALTELMVAGAKEDEAFVRGLNPLDAYLLGKEIFEVNQDFFMTKVAPKLPKGKKKVEKRGKK